MFLRFEFSTGDASGHHMTTPTADRLLTYLLETLPGIRSTCPNQRGCPQVIADRKNRPRSARRRAASARWWQRVRRCRVHPPRTRVRAAVTAESLFCNQDQRAIDRMRAGWAHFGSSTATGERALREHAAGFYLATGQDAANIVEGSQGVTVAEDRDGDLYFSCTIPNLIVGTVGNGKNLPFVETNLTRLGCRAERAHGENARRLAVLAAATVLYGALSLLAAQTNPGELMRAHVHLERSSEKIGSQS
nr:hypothetical protein [Lentzea atacamensis]